MHKQAHGLHAKEEKLAVSEIQSTLSFLTPWLVILDELEKHHNSSLAQSFFVCDYVTSVQ